MIAGRLPIDAQSKFKRTDCKAWVLGFLLLFGRTGYNALIKLDTGFPLKPQALVRLIVLTKTLSPKRLDNVALH